MYLNRPPWCVLCCLCLVPYVVCVLCPMLSVSCVLCCLCLVSTNFCGLELCPLICQKFQFLRLLLNNLSYALANHFKYVHKVSDHKRQVCPGANIFGAELSKLFCILNIFWKFSCCFMCSLIWLAISPVCWAASTKYTWYSKVMYLLQIVY
jgi:hypothetical protein